MIIRLQAVGRTEYTPVFRRVFLSFLHFSSLFSFLFSLLLFYLSQNVYECAYCVQHPLTDSMLRNENSVCFYLRYELCVDVEKMPLGSVYCSSWSVRTYIHACTQKS